MKYRIQEKPLPSHPDLDDSVMYEVVDVVGGRDHSSHDRPLFNTLEEAQAWIGKQKSK